MKLTLNAAETGHLVIATLHSSTIAEALQRVVSAFPAEIQPGICAQLGDCLVGAVSQRLAYRREPGIRVPECEILMASSGARGAIRQGQFFKLATVLESGAADGCYSLERYRVWLDIKQDWARPMTPSPEVAEEPIEGANEFHSKAKRIAASKTKHKAPAGTEDGSVLVIDDRDSDLTSVIEELERGKR